MGQDVALGRVVRAHDARIVTTMKALTPRARAEGVLFLITFIWGSTFVVTKDLLASVTPFAHIGIRFSVAALILAAVSWRVIVHMKAIEAARGAVLGALLLGGFALQTVGLTTTTASKSAFITGMLVVFTPLCQVAFERRLPKLGTVVGVVFVIIGLFFLTSPAGGGFTIGDALTVGCAFLFGVYIVVLDVYSGTVAPEHLTIMQFLVCAVGGMLGAMFLETPVVKVSVTAGVQLLYLAVFATVIALFFQTKYQKDTTPARSAVIYSIEPLIAAVLAATIAGERIGGAGILGGGLIMAGVLLSEFSDVLIIRRKRISD